MTTPNAFDALVNAVAERVIERMAVAQPTRRLLSLKEAGRELGGKSASSVRTMIRNGDIPSAAVKRIGERRIYLDRFELDKFLKAA